MPPKISKTLTYALRNLALEEEKSQKRIVDARNKRYTLNINSCLALRPEFAAGVVDHLTSVGVDWREIEAHQKLLYDIPASLQEADVKHLIPQCAGCSITKDTTWHFRWVGVYKNKVPQVPPYACTKTFMKEGPEEDILVDQKNSFIYVATWLWDEHKSATGEDCPWKFQ